MKRKISKIILISILFTALIMNMVVVNAEPPELPEGNRLISGGPGGGNPPEKPDGEPGNNQAESSIVYAGATVFSEDTTEEGKKYSSTTGGENAILAEGGNSTIKNFTLNKSGNSDGENADFYGTNAGILSHSGATLNIDGGNITTNGTHANAVFAGEGGFVNIYNSKITTSGNNSGAVMVTGGGNLTAINVTASTSGNSSAPIRSDRGGGLLAVEGGEYTSTGVGSPTIYSTADVIVNGANLTSTSSEGIVIEGGNSVTLTNSNLVDTNTSLNGNSETYKNIFLYQSMSGDASEGSSSFSATKSKITTNKGDTFFVTNTIATISLTENEIVNNDSEGALLRIQAGKWGTAGANGGNVELNLSTQNAKGNIVLDNISTLNFNILNESKYSGTINGGNTAKNLVLSLDSTSTITLEGDSYVSELNNGVSDNSNINLNGFKLYVNGEAITYTDYKEEQDTDVKDVTVTKEKDNKINFEINSQIMVLIAAFIIICGAIIIIIVKKSKKIEKNKNK